MKIAQYTKSLTVALRQETYDKIKAITDNAASVWRTGSEKRARNRYWKIERKETSKNETKSIVNNEK